LRYGATDVPIIQLSLSSDSLPDTKLNDLGQNIIRRISRSSMAASSLSLWRQASRHHGRPRPAGACFARIVALGRRLGDFPTNVILPSGDVKIGTKDYRSP